MHLTHGTGNTISPADYLAAMSTELADTRKAALHGLTAAITATSDALGFSRRLDGASHGLSASMQRSGARSPRLAAVRTGFDTASSPDASVDNKSGTATFRLRASHHDVTLQTLEEDEEFEDDADELRSASPPHSEQLSPRCKSQQVHGKASRSPASARRGPQFEQRQGRPDVAALLADAADAALDAGENRVALLICSNPGLAASLRHEARCYESVRFDVHEEQFGF